MTAVELLSALPDHIRSQWPYAPRFTRVNGWRMHYVDEGAGDPVVLLHGNPTWGFLYRDVIPPLVAAGHRVIVPDMIGFSLRKSPIESMRTASTVIRRISSRWFASWVSSA